MCYNEPEQKLLLELCRFSIHFVLFKYWQDMKRSNIFPTVLPGPWYSWSSLANSPPDGVFYLTGWLLPAPCLCATTRTCTCLLNEPEYTVEELQRIEAASDVTPGREESSAVLPDTVYNWWSRCGKYALMQTTELPELQRIVQLQEKRERRKTTNTNGRISYLSIE